MLSPLPLMRRLHFSHPTLRRRSGKVSIGHRYEGISMKEEESQLEWQIVSQVRTRERDNFIYRFQWLSQSHYFFILFPPFLLLPSVESVFLFSFLRIFLFIGPQSFYFSIAQRRVLIKTRTRHRPVRKEKKLRKNRWKSRQGNWSRWCISPFFMKAFPALKIGNLFPGETDVWRWGWFKELWRGVACGAGVGTRLKIWEGWRWW